MEKKLTPMQELISFLDLGISLNADNGELKFQLEGIKHKAQQLMSSEKHQIVTAYEQGVICQIPNYGKNINAQQYFAQTYKTE